ncbi:hypothetical protein BHAOGJBA_4280 [Methylobacterium hispanicum]|uniref:Uncharacterized protein n=1 Tax=Methylobacterium hispanicum TaxID=270350 RepID=A0AAV4ZSA4_9HYPH|nr:hypothetical protein [Methylobacterium hispanicum]GJD90738.1 hypothetical protein BHAOGJBA_4280 [Methylobacterium hispanicum]
MSWDRERLLQEYVVTTSNALFKVVQDRIGVTEGDLAAQFWIGHDIIDRTVEAIERRAPGFQITEDLAFGAAWPTMTAIPDAEPASLRSAGEEYLRRLGELVGADLADGELVGQYEIMLRDYVASEVAAKVSYGTRG